MFLNFETGCSQFVTDFLSFGTVTICMGVFRMGSGFTPNESIPVIKAYECIQMPRGVHHPRGNVLDFPRFHFCNFTISENFTEIHTFPLFQKKFFPPSFNNFSLFSIDLCDFYLIYVFFLPPCFDHDAFMHHTIHILDAPANTQNRWKTLQKCSLGTFLMIC